MCQKGSIRSRIQLKDCDLVTTVDEFGQQKSTRKPVIFFRKTKYPLPILPSYEQTVWRRVGWEERVSIPHPFPVAKFIVTESGDKFDPGIGMSYRPASLCTSQGLWIWIPGFRIRIHFLRIRIRIQRIRMEANTDPDTDPDPIRIRIRIQSGSRTLMTKNWIKITAEKKIKFFFDQKLQFRYLSLGLHKVCPGYRRSLQLTKEAIQHFKTWIFSIFVGHFCPPGSGSGSVFKLRIRIRIQWSDWIRIQYGSGYGSGSETLLDTALINFNYGRRHWSLFQYYITL